jgi:hypothetical protein
MDAGADPVVVRGGIVVLEVGVHILSGTVVRTAQALDSSDWWKSITQISHTSCMRTRTRSEGGQEWVSWLGMLLAL